MLRENKSRSCVPVELVVQEGNGGEFVHSILLKSRRSNYLTKVDDGRTVDNDADANDDDDVEGKNQ